MTDISLSDPCRHYDRYIRRTTPHNLHKKGLDPLASISLQTFQSIKRRQNMFKKTCRWGHDRGINEK